CGSKISAQPKRGSSEMMIFHNSLVHALIHAKQPFYACRYCDFETTMPRRLKVHLASKHGRQSSKGNQRDLSELQCKEIENLVLKCFANDKSNYVETKKERKLKNNVIREQK